MKNKTVTHYCEGCKKKHAVELDGWGLGWHTTSKKKYYCREHVECVGCGEVHIKTPYMKNASKVHPKTGKKVDGWWCEKWVSAPPPSMSKIIDGLSPQEVMSGVQYGMERDPALGADSEDYSVERARDMAELNQALDDL